MAYNYQRGYNRMSNSAPYNPNYGNRNGGNYSNNGGGYNNNYAPQNSQPFKKSGCTYVQKKDKEYMSGWNKSKAGLMSFIASPRLDSSKRKTGSSDWENWFVKITMPDRTIVKTNGLFQVTTNKLFLKDLQMVANPKAPSGTTRSGRRVSGYFGTYIRRK